MYDLPVINLRESSVSSGKIMVDGKPVNGLLAIYSEHCPHCVDFESVYQNFAELNPDIKCYAVEDIVEHIVKLVDKAIDGGLQFIPYKMTVENGVPIDQE